MSILLTDHNGPTDARQSIGHQKRLLHMPVVRQCSHAHFWKIGLKHMSRDMRFPTMWYVRPAKAQTSMRIRAVWSEPLLVA